MGTLRAQPRRLGGSLSLSEWPCTPRLTGRSVRTDVSKFRITEARGIDDRHAPGKGAASGRRSAKQGTAVITVLRMCMHS
jgi:hypothetical protein